MFKESSQHCVVLTTAILAFIAMFRLYAPNVVVSCNTTKQTFRSSLPRRDNISESLLAYMHIPKTGGTSFNAMIVNEPFSFGRSHALNSHGPLSGDSSLLNCGLLGACCEQEVPASLVAADIIKGACNHISYEAQWPFWERFLEKKPNALLLTHLREPFSHAVSWMGHNLRRGRIQSFHESLYNQTGISIDNFLHRHQFPTSNTTEILFILEHHFFWFGITEHTEASACLLMWQLRVFDQRACRLLCSNMSETIATFPMKNHAHSMGRIQKVAGKALLSQEDMRQMAMRTQKDQYVYDEALRIFSQRVQLAEENVGFRFLHCHNPLY